MGRAHPVAAIYKVTDMTNGKIYIGESSNIIDRFSSYRTAARGRIRPPMNAIYTAVYEKGIDNFIFKILVSQDDDPQLTDVHYRRKLEAEYIAKYNATDPAIGYNRMNETSGYIGSSGRKKGFKTSTGTKLIKSEPLLAYSHKDGSVMMFMNSQSCAEILGFTDRAIIIRCMHNGKSSHGYTFFKLDFAKRLENATNIIKRKMDPNGRKLQSKQEALERYLTALYAANEWCIEFGMTCVDIDSITKQ